MLTYKQASGFRHRRNKFTKPEDLESGVMPMESPFALAAELAMCKSFSPTPFLPELHGSWHYKTRSGSKNTGVTPEPVSPHLLPISKKTSLTPQTSPGDTSPVHSASPTRAATPDLDQHPELRAITSHEEDILFFGSAIDPNAPRVASEHGVLAGLNPIMEALLRLERADAMAAANGLLYT